MKINRVETSTKMLLDSLSGEVISEEKEIVSKQISITADKEMFWLLYAQFIDLIFCKEKPSHVAKDIFFWLLRENPGKTESFGITLDMKKRMSVDMNVSIGSINNNLKNAVDTGLLIKGDCKGSYKINPEYAFKGATKDRKALLNISLKSE